MPRFGNQATCAYCGSRFVIPASVRSPETNTFSAAQTFDSRVPEAQVNVARWVKWLVIIIVVTTVVPVVCGVIAAFCGALAPIVGLFFSR